MRLQTFLAHAGISSRRGAESVIVSGRVRVNGEVVVERAFSVNPYKDNVTVDGKVISRARNVYYLINKPKGVTSTVRDEHAARTVIDLLPKSPGRPYPIGRLDRDTTGLLLLTNDGDLAYRLTHPRFGVKKVYRVKVKGIVTKEAIRKLEAGVELEDGATAPCRIKVLTRTIGETVCEVELHEGKKRQIRRMFDTIGHRVLDLKRTLFAGMGLGSLKEGEYRELTDGEINTLKKHAAVALKATHKTRGDE